MKFVMHFVKMTISNSQVVFGRGSNHALLTETNRATTTDERQKTQRDYNGQLVQQRHEYCFQQLRVSDYKFDSTVLESNSIER